MPPLSPAATAPPKGEPSCASQGVSYRKPTPVSPAGAWAAPNSPTRQARPGGTTNSPAAHLPPPDVVKAAVVEQVLLGQAGVAAKGFGVRAGEEQCHGPLHPHVQGEALRLVKAVEQGALRHLGPPPRGSSAAPPGPPPPGSRLPGPGPPPPAATFLAASSRYLARNPARRGARSSREQAESFSGPGKLCQPVSPMGSPSSRHSRSMMPLIRGMWLFWEMRKEHRASQGSWRRMRIPGAKAAAWARAGLIPDRARRFSLVVRFQVEVAAPKILQLFLGTGQGQGLPPVLQPQVPVFCGAFPHQALGVRRTPAEGLAAVQCLGQVETLGDGRGFPEMGRFHRLSPSCIKIQPEKMHKKGAFSPSSLGGPGALPLFCPSL